MPRRKRTDNSRTARGRRGQRGRKLAAHEAEDLIVNRRLAKLNRQIKSLKKQRSAENLVDTREQIGKLIDQINEIKAEAGRG